MELIWLVCYKLTLSPILAIDDKDKVDESHDSECSDERPKHCAQDAPPRGYVQGPSSRKHCHTSHPKILACALKQIVLQGNQTPRILEQLDFQQFFATAYCYSNDLKEGNSLL